MGKTAACIKIIQILSCRDIVSTMELSEILETNPRNIKEYIKELELLGYTISSYKGKYGGYKLDKRELLPSVKLNDNERSALVLGTDFLHNCPDFLKYSEYESAMGKVMASFDSKNELTPITMVDRFPLSIGFYPISQNEYLAILRSLIQTHISQNTPNACDRESQIDDIMDTLRQKAINFATQIGNRSPRTAKDFFTFYCNQIFQ